MGRMWCYGDKKKYEDEKFSSFYGKDCIIDEFGEGVVIVSVM